MLLEYKLKWRKNQGNGQLTRAQMTATPQGLLDPKVGDALLEESSVMDIMQNPKMVEAIQALKTDPTAYGRLTADDPELREMFETLRGKMDEKEQSKSAAQAATEHTRTMDSPAVEEDVPPLAEADKLECDAAKAEGTRAFEAGDFEVACARYERAAKLEKHHAPHWTNLAVARLRAGRSQQAAEAAREATRLNPRFSKGWLRLGEALEALGEFSEAVTVFEAGLKRAEGAIRLQLTKGLQRATNAAAHARPAMSVGGAKGKGGAAKGGAAEKQSSLPKQFYPNGWKGPKGEGEPSEAAAEPAERATSGMPAAPEPPKPRPPKPLPTVEDERLMADETARLREATEDKMKRYAEMAKQQTRAAAAVKSRPAAPPPSPPFSAASAAATATGAPAAAVASSAADAPRRKVLVVEESDDDDDDSSQGGVVGGAAAGGAAAGGAAAGEVSVGEAAPCSLLPAPAEQLDRTGTSSAVEGSAAALGAALAQWSGDRAKSGGSASPEPSAPAAPPLPVLPTVSLSNDLLFEIA